MADIEITSDKPGSPATGFEATDTETKAIPEPPALPRDSPELVAGDGAPEKPTRRASKVGSALVSLPHSAAPKTNVMPTREVPKVCLSARSRLRGRSSMGSTFIEPNRIQKKLVSWKEATESRPPLQIDMDTPGPCTYSPKIKPLNETNAPAYTMRPLCVYEKKVAGSRTSWEKSWFQNSDVWTTKADLSNDFPWPSPGTYEIMGGRRSQTPQASAGNLISRKFSAYNVSNSFVNPSPNQYDKKRADKLLYHSAPARSHSLRFGGTVLWGKREMTPGPGEYRDVYSKTRKHFPNFSMKKTVRENIPCNLGPYGLF